MEEISQFITWYVKHAGFAAIVGMLMVKLVLATFADSRIAGTTLGEVLHVTLNCVPSAADSCTRIVLLAVTAVVLMVQVAADALVAQENTPAEADPHAATDGLAAVPVAAQIVVLKSLGAVTVPVKVGLARGAAPVTCPTV